MNELLIVGIGAFVLVGGVILYAVVSTATGIEEDKNKNYIPDWIEKNSLVYLSQVKTLIRFH